MNQFLPVLRFSIFQTKKINVYSVNLLKKRGLKFAADIKWVRPEKKPVYHPSNSGDLSGVEEPSKDSLLLNFQNCEELKSGDSLLKKIFSLEYSDNNAKLKLILKDLVDKVKQDPYDNSSPEVEIAKLTAKIRFYQVVLMEDPTKRKLVAKVKELIDKRYKMLNCVRRSDYRKFEWILEQLNICYQPNAMYQSVSRKKSLMLIANLGLKKQKEEKIAQLKETLDQKKVPFLEKKIEKLKWIKEMEEKNNLPSTVTDEKIQKLVECLEKVKVEVAERAKIGYKRKIHPYTLEAYHENLLKQKEIASRTK